MSRTVVTNSLWYTAGTALRQLIGIILLPLYTHFLTSAEFGGLVVLQAYTLLLVVLGPLQLPNAIFREYAECADDMARQRVLMSTIGATTIIISAFAAAFMFQVVSRRESFLPSLPGTRLALALAMLSGFMQIVMTVPQFYLVARQQAARSALIGSVAAGATALWVAAEFTVYGGSVAGALRADVFGGTVAFGVAMLLTRRAYGIVYDVTLLGRCLRYSIPLLPHSLGGYLFSYSDRLILQRYVPAASIAVYGVSERVGMLVRVVVNNFITAFSPHYMQTAVRNPKEASAMTARVAPVLMFHLGVVVVGLACLAHLLVRFLAGPQYASAAPLVPIFGLAFFFRQLYSFSTLNLFLERRTERIAAVTLTAGVINVLLNLLLVPHYGIVAAAVVTLVSFVLTFVLGISWSTDVAPVLLGGEVIVAITVVVTVATALIILTDLLVAPGLMHVIARLAGVAGMLVVGKHYSVISVTDVRRLLGYFRSRPKGI